MKKEEFIFTRKNSGRLGRPAKINLTMDRLVSAAFLFLVCVLSVSAQQRPSVSVGHQQLPITYEDCLVRARQALELEGYETARGGGNFYWGGKGIHHASIVCDGTPDNRMDVHVFVASTSSDGSVAGAERVRLQQRMERPTTGGANNTSGACSPFEGVWTTNYTPITFRRNGNRVTGSYEYSGASTLSGTLSGNVLEGEYSQPNYPNASYRRGRFMFVLSADGQSFTGQWWDANGNLGGSAWNGRCQTPSDTNRGSTTVAGGMCDDPRTQAIMDDWLRSANPVENQTPGYNLRYEPWGRLVGTSPTANITAPNPPETDLSRCEWLWKQAANLRSTNLGILREYVEQRVR